MNNKHVRRLKQLVQDAAHHAGVNYRRFCDEFPVEEFFGAVGADDSAPAVAIGALRQLCVGEAGFNNNTVGLKAVLQFLAESSTEEPSLDQDVKACLTDLKKTLDRGDVTFDTIGAWLDRWYQF